MGLLQLSERVAVLLALAWAGFAVPAAAQSSIRFEVYRIATTIGDCDNPLGGDSDPAWRWKGPDIINACYTTTCNGCTLNIAPIVLYDQTFACGAVIPNSIDVQFLGCEDDGAGCSGGTFVGICQGTSGDITNTWTIPTWNGMFDVGPVTTTSTGCVGDWTYWARWVVTGRTTNDLICDAIDLGPVLGCNAFSYVDAGTGQFSNICGTNTGDPSPWGGTNDQGVWFTFNTTSHPPNSITINALNDPLGQGQYINLQLAVYTSSDNSCSGALTPVNESYTTGSIAESLVLAGPLANTSYYLLVDGQEVIGPPGVDGYFGLEIVPAQVGNPLDMICDAHDMGILSNGLTLGNNAFGDLDNTCATNTNDPAPTSWSNDQGVWFRFTTANDFNAYSLEVDAKSDPQGAGDPIDLQLALYVSSDNSCNGALTLVAEDYDPGLFDEQMTVDCPSAGTTYFLLVDGGSFNQEGFFGLEVTASGVEQAADLICDAEDLGLVLDSDSVFTPPLSRSNACATNANDPVPPVWDPDKTVWFLFQAPSTGHVVIRAHSDLPWPIGTDAIDLQLAVYGTSDGTCSGVLQHLNSSYYPGLIDETMEVRCLTPGENYWILADGSDLNVDGIFDITVSDGGIPPAPNDEICDAIALGEPPADGVVGLTDQNNYCADNIQEPLPDNWGNDQGVWYSFIAPPSGKVEVRLDNDPFGDSIDLQVAVYESAGDSCTGALTELAGQHDGAGLYFDENMEVECLEPGRTYWILVDGEGSLVDPDLQEGMFDIEVYGDPRDPAAPNDAPCEALFLGDPTGGSVGTIPGPDHPSQNNYCASSAGEPQPLRYTADRTVWYSFLAPSTGSVEVEVNSDFIYPFGYDAIDLRLAAYTAQGCGGPFTELFSGDDRYFNVDSVFLHCLTPGDTIFLQVDGSAMDGEGYFDLTIHERPGAVAPPNDDLCGSLLIDPWSDPDTLYGQNNICTDAAGDPAPSAFTPERTVWYHFETPAMGGPFAVEIMAISSWPYPYGPDAIDLRMAVFESDNEQCSGGLNEVQSAWDPLQFNASMSVHCLDAGRTYFLMVDGSDVDPMGYFDLIVTQIPSVPQPTNDLICDAIPLDTVPIGGSIDDGVSYFNFCSTADTGEPNAGPEDRTVWFSFVTPPHPGADASADVMINVWSDPNAVGDAVDLRVALFRADGDTCTGGLDLVDSDDPLFSSDASINVSCLVANTRYYLQVMGTVLNKEGYFGMEIIDMGSGAFPSNSDLCASIPLGVLSKGDSLLDDSFDNLCATGNGVWFNFHTGDSLGSGVLFEVLNDPLGVGDAISAGVELYRTSDTTCTGSLEQVQGTYLDPGEFDRLMVECLDTNTTYWLKIGTIGGLLSNGEGYFGLRVISDDQACSCQPWYADLDGDFLGDPDQVRMACSPPAGYVSNASDLCPALPFLSPGDPCNDGNNSTYNDMVTAECICESHPILLSPRVFLGGPYESASGLMIDSLRNLADFPLTEPYTALGYVHAGNGGGENVFAIDLDLLSGPDAVVDWVVVELYIDLLGTMILVDTRSALLQRDGDIIEAYQAILQHPIAFERPAGQYFVAIRHRNHLGVMLRSTVTLGTTNTVVDFTDPATATFGTDAQKAVGPVNVLWPGDVTFNGQVKYAGGGNDRDPILVRIGGTIPTSVANGYLQEDVNLNGQVKYAGSKNDRDPILVNIGGTIPTATRTEQLP
ncbi:MAG: hypothetical protein H6597_07200 [Flavobacteriales bacterium]|nr:hypothetical protein [Flavobacteriales bacterium]MCB9194305.1 hypothetical protein [Flavobacteriales bacterium]